MRYILFTTTSCPKCPEVKDFVAEHVPFGGEILDETDPDFGDLVGNFEVAAAPCFVVLGEEDEEVFRGNEVGEIEDFLNAEGLV